MVDLLEWHVWIVLSLVYAGVRAANEGCSIVVFASGSLHIWIIVSGHADLADSVNSLHQVGQRGAAVHWQRRAPWQGRIFRHVVYTLTLRDWVLSLQLRRGRLWDADPRFVCRLCVRGCQGLLHKFIRPTGLYDD